MKALKLSEIMAAFDPIDQPQVVAPNLGWVDWDSLEYLSWHHPKDATAYLLTVLPERAVGLVLRPSSERGRGICNLCYGVDRTQGTRLMMVENWQRPRVKQGIHICSELNCSDTVRGGLWVYRMSETISVGRRIERLQEHLQGFVREVTGIGATKPPLGLSAS